MDRALRPSSGPEGECSQTGRAPYEIAVRAGLHLRLRDAQDHEMIYRAVCDNQDHLGTFLPWTINYDPEVAIVDHRNAVDRNRTGQQALYCIFDQDEFAGCISLYQIFDGYAKLGGWLVESAQGKGVMSESATALLDVGFNTLRLDGVIAHVLPENVRSQQVLHRLGGAPQGNNDDGEMVFIIEKEAWALRHA